MAVWQIVEGTPRRAMPTTLGLEKELEDWIEHEPGLVDDGLTIVGRQAHLGSAGRLDLLAVDSAGRWVVIEIKPDTLHRETIAQALDYAAYIAAATPDALRRIVSGYFEAKPGAPHPDESAGLFDDGPREVQVIVVGAGADGGLGRLAGYLAGFNVPIRSVVFQVLKIDGALMLMREVAEVGPAAPMPVVSGATVESVLESASPSVRQACMTVVDAAASRGLGIRPYKRSIMITPPQNRTRALITLWNLGDRATVFISRSKFEQFYGVLPEVVDSTFGPLDAQGDRDLDQQVAAQVIAGLDALVA